VNNAIRHSGGNEVKIIFEANEKLRIQITDNGTGIKDQGASYGGGNGCVNIRDRATAAGWRASWQQNIPTGTSVLIEDNLS
jgi:signal transduction histidine kinase